MIEQLKKDLKAIEVVPVGSRISCNPSPKDTDIDFLVLLGKRTLPDGYQLDNNEAHYEPNEGEFNSWRKGNVNLIVTDSFFFFESLK